MTLVFPSSLIIHRSFSLSVFHSATILRHDSCSEGLLQTHYVANKGLPVPPGCWSYRYAPCWSRPVFPSPRQRVEHQSSRVAGHTKGTRAGEEGQQSWGLELHTGTGQQHPIPLFPPLLTGDQSSSFLFLPSSPHQTSDHRHQILGW